MRSFYMDDFKTYPKDLITILDKFRPELAKFLNRKPDIQAEIAMLQLDATSFYEEPALHELKRKIFDCLNTLEIHAYHNTRVLSKENIKESGLEPLERTSYLKRLSTILDQSPFREEKVELLKELKPFFAGERGERESLLAFYVSKTRCSDYKKFGKNVGGEVAEFAFEASHQDVLNYLWKIGKPVTVEFLIPVKNIYWCGFRAYFMVSELCRKYIYQRELNRNYEINFDAQTKTAILPQSIVSVTCMTS